MIIYYTLDIVFLKSLQQDLRMKIFMNFNHFNFIKIILSVLIFLNILGNIIEFYLNQTLHIWVFI